MQHFQLFPLGIEGRVNWVEKCNQLKKKIAFDGSNSNSRAQKMYEQALKELFRCISNLRKSLKWTSWRLHVHTQSFGDIYEL